MHPDIHQDKIQPLWGLSPNGDTHVMCKKLGYKHRVMGPNISSEFQNSHKNPKAHGQR